MLDFRDRWLVGQSLEVRNYVFDVGRPESCVILEKSTHLIIRFHCKNKC